MLTALAKLKRPPLKQTVQLPGSSARHWPGRVLVVLHCCRLRTTARDCRCRQTSRITAMCSATGKSTATTTRGMHPARTQSRFNSVITPPPTSPRRGGHLPNQRLANVNKQVALFSPPASSWPTRAAGHERRLCSLGERCGQTSMNEQRVPGALANFASAVRSATSRISASAT